MTGLIRGFHCEKGHYAAVMTLGPRSTYARHQTANVTG